ncbi:uncharacterized protein IAS62_005117 [Cryptococcus decagattii]|uniref:Uncharacterized protein n=1 Tax=Cryptococcus decagattii TaxID=1859122 RepID=A0ABZ2B4W1_9TREE
MWHHRSEDARRLIDCAFLLFPSSTFSFFPVKESSLEVEQLAHREYSHSPTYLSFAFRRVLISSPRSQQGNILGLISSRKLPYDWMKLAS